MKVAVHQPNFLPYLGFFDKARQVDIFVILDDVEYTRGGYTKRNRIKKPNGVMWLTVPITGSKTVQIKDILLANHLSWQDQHLKTLKHMYSNAEHYNEIIPEISKTYKKEWKYLLNFNMELLRTCFNMLEIDTDIQFSSNLNVTAEDGSSRIIEICKELGADHYLSGITGKKYLNVDDYKAGGIELSFHEFEHPVYTQLFDKFIPNLSVIDYLMNEGAKPFWQK